ncbi:MAG: T9SS type A sorting domain-containing protein, partial [Bacteroidota bacterium]
TGNVIAGPVTTMSDPNVSTVASQTGPGTLYVQAFYNGLAAPTSRFFGLGEVVWIEMNVLPAFQVGNTTATFNLSNVDLGYTFFWSSPCGNDGQLTYGIDSVLNGRLNYWAGTMDPIRYFSPFPTQYLPTSITGTDLQCVPTGAAPTFPNTSGIFSHHIGDGPAINITRDIPGDFNTPCNSTQLGNVITSNDAFLAQMAPIPGGTPLSVFQILSLDVNRDGRVLASDATLIQWRSVQSICEYPQPGIYPNPTVPAIDWLFVRDSLIQNDPAFQVSTAYPFDDGVGYSPQRVPNVPDCIRAPVFQAYSGCIYVDTIQVWGICLGDGDGSWVGTAPLASEVRMANVPHVEVDLAAAVAGTEGEWRVPVRVSNVDTAVALDLRLPEIPGLEVLSPDFDAATRNFVWNTIPAGVTFYSGISLHQAGFSDADPVFFLRLRCTPDFNVDSLTSSTALTNGKYAQLDINGNLPCQNITATPSPTDPAATVRIAPNPMQATFQLDYTDFPGRIHRITLYNATGQLLREIPLSPARHTRVSMLEYPAGFYFLRLNDTYTYKLLHD